MRRRYRRWLLCLLAALTLCSHAAAEPLAVLEALAQRPVQATIQAEVLSHMPLGEQRTAQLDRLLHHIALKVCASPGPERWGSLSVLVDGVPALALTEHISGAASVLESSASGAAWSVQGESALEALLDLGSQRIDLGLTGSELTLLDDGDALLDGVLSRYGDAMKRTNKKVTLTGFGIGAYTLSLTIPKGDLERWQNDLTACCPDGWLCTLLAGLTFSGKQTMTLVCTDEGEVIRVAYAGKAGSDAAHLREIQLTWKRARQDGAAEDDLTLRSPAAKGRDKDSLALTRSLRVSDGAEHWIVDSSYSGMHSGVKQALTFTCDLTLDSLVDATRLTGAANVTQTLDDHDMTWTLEPELLFSGEPLLTGTVGVRRLVDNANDEYARLHVTIAPLDGMDWSISAPLTALDGMNEQELEAVRQRMMQEAASALVKRLVLLPDEDVLFLSEGIAPEIWETIRSAAERSAR